ncbi:AI-2E family transporter [Mycolicibacterium moriokaense]|nr:AI-2E family transporter [Mycolicibacterium moriokaense]
MAQAQQVSRSHLGPPHAMVVAASWSWRVVFVALAAWVIAKAIDKLLLLVIAIIAALVLAALLRPVSAALQRYLPGVVSALVTLFFAVLVMVGIGYFVVWRAVQDAPALVDQSVAIVQNVRDRLSTLMAQSPQFDQLAQSITGWLQRHRSNAIDIVSASATYTVEAVTGLALTFFITFFLLYDGGRIWRWLLRYVGDDRRDRFDQAGHAAWGAVKGYTRGVVTIATVHAVVIGVSLVLLGTPLAAALAVLVFLGSFIPLAGALIAGGLCILVTLATGGWIPALILLGILLLESQLEAHILQPLIMGRNVQLHPLAVGVTITAGTLLAGILGAVIAVPLAAVVYRAAPVLLGREHEEVA